MASQIRVLSIRQPFADQIIFGDKWNELRSWETKYRGQLYIHASRWDGSKFQETPGQGTIGATIGRVELVECLPENDMRAIARHLHSNRKCSGRLEPVAKFLKGFGRQSWEHGIGCWNWILAEPVSLLKPISILGKLNVWRADVDDGQLRFAKLTPSQSRGPSVKSYLEDARSRKAASSPLQVQKSLATFLKREKEFGCQFTPEVLEALARTWNTTTESLRNALNDDAQFERVPGKTKGEEWWRIHSDSKSPVITNTRPSTPRRPSTTKRS